MSALSALPVGLKAGEIFLFANRKSYFLSVIGPLQVAIHVVQNRRTGEQKSHWDKTNKGNYHLKLCMPFVCLVPVRLLLTSTAVLYHVNGYLQRAYFRIDKFVS